MKQSALRVLQRFDRAFDRLYGWKYNPLYHSGAIAAVLSLVLLVTGLYLIIYYRIGSPYESVERITGQVWTGRWIRGLHRYASDAAIVAILVHAVRMFLQGRSWGPRALAWISGLVLTGLFLVCGWTGYVMVWDVQAQVLASEGARFLDAIPLFSEPIGRTFMGGTELPAAFFFMNLFLHIALPIGLGIVLWLHVSRLARPNLAPPRLLSWVTIGVLTVLAVVWPIGMAARADLLHVPGQVPIDLFYGFWLPVTLLLPAWGAWTLAIALVTPLFLIPWLTRPRKERVPPPSWVNPRYCTECVQCSIDCPYEAISMVPREDGRFPRIAEVDPALCVSCGICAGSCAPMGVGPEGRNGRDQIDRVREVIRQRSAIAAPGIVVVGCERAAAWPDLDRIEGVERYPVGCAGSVHSSVIEFLLRSGVAGVLVLTCPPRDCWNREGPKWTAGRIYGGREAELKPRVDRDRVKTLVSPPTAAELSEQIESFRRLVAGKGTAPLRDDVALDFECEPAELEGHEAASNAPEAR